MKEKRKRLLLQSSKNDGLTLVSGDVVVKEMIANGAMKYNARTRKVSLYACGQLLCRMWRTARAQGLACAAPRQSLRGLRAAIRHVHVCPIDNSRRADRWVRVRHRQIHATIATAARDSTRRKFTAVRLAGESERHSAPAETGRRIKRECQPQRCHRRRGLHLRRAHPERHALSPPRARRRRTMLSAQRDAQPSPCI
jgi:hypothetical protein